jgi:hypothetical protein
MLDDPLFLQVRAARPVPPARLLASISARLPVRTRPRSAPLLGGAVVAVAALALAIVLLASPVRLSAPSAAQTAKPVGRDAGVADAHLVAKPDAVDIARRWMRAMRSGDVDAATALLGAPFAHAGMCAEGKARWDAPSQRVTVAGDARAVRHVMACVLQTFRSPFYREPWSVDHDLSLERVTVSEITNGDHAIGDRALRKRVVALAVDHELVLASLRLGKESASIYLYVIAIDDAGKIDAVFLIGVDEID